MKKSFIRRMCLTFFCCSVFMVYTFSKAFAQEITLDNWQVQSSIKVSQSGSQLTNGSALVSNWYPAKVPSTVMGVLTSNGLYKDILHDENYKTADKAPFKSSWWYKTAFYLPEGDNAKYVNLLFEGLSYRANIWLNGHLIASKQEVYGPFRQYSFDVTKYIKDTNHLAVEVFSAKSGEPNIGFVDWNPRPLDESMGIFRPVKVMCTKNAMLRNTWVKSDVNTKTLEEALLTIETEVYNYSGEAVEGVIEGAIDNKKFKLPVNVDANNKKKIRITPAQIEALNLKKPRLWWCNGMGKPNLYTLDLKLMVRGEEVSKQAIDFGIRKIETYTTEKGHKGFKLNGRRVLVKSAGWTDDIFLRDNDRSNELQISYVKHMNLNSIRFENIWGTSQNLYDLCDRNGLLAIVGWSCQWEWEEYLGIPHDDYGCIKSDNDMDLLARSLEDQVLWLRNHPSIIAWMAGSDKLPRPELEKRYIKVLREIDDRPYLGAAKQLKSEVTGTTGMKMNGPYEYVGPNYWFVDSLYGGAFGFNTETGAGAALPVLESTRKMMPESKLWPLNAAWDYHCTTSTSAMNSMKAISRVVTSKFGAPSTIEDFTFKAQFLNYESTKSMFEAFRLNRKEGTGIVQWMLNSAWPSLYWQLYDFYMIPVPAYYGVKKGNEACQLIFNYKDNCIYLVNDTERDLDNVNVAVKGLDLNSKVLLDKSYKISSKANSIQKITRIEGKDMFLQLRLSNGIELNIENSYILTAKQDTYLWEKTDWVHTPIKEYANLRGINTAAKVRLSVKIVDGNKLTRDTRSGLCLEVELFNPSESIAFFTQLLLKDINGEIVYPVYWEDNYVSVLPGDRRVLRCFFNNSEIEKSFSVLEVDGLNVEKKRIKLK